MSDIPNQLLEGKILPGASTLPSLSNQPQQMLPGGSGLPSLSSQPQQIMLVPATRPQAQPAQQVVYHQAPPQQQPVVYQQQVIVNPSTQTQQHYILQPGGFDSNQATYQVIHPQTGTVQILGASSVAQPIQTILQPTTSLGSAGGAIIKCAAVKTTQPSSNSPSLLQATTASTPTTLGSAKVFLQSPRPTGLQQQPPTASRSAQRQIMPQQLQLPQPTTTVVTTSPGIRTVVSTAPAGMSGKQIQVLSPHTGTWSPVSPAQFQLASSLKTTVPSSSGSNTKPQQVRVQQMGGGAGSYRLLPASSLVAREPSRLTKTSDFVSVDSATARVEPPIKVVRPNSAAASFSLTSAARASFSSSSKSPPPHVTTSSNLFTSTATTAPVSAEKPSLQQPRVQMQPTSLLDDLATKAPMPQGVEEILTSGNSSSVEESSLEESESATEIISEGVVETSVECGSGFEDITTLMDWNSEGVASLPGSDIKFKINEFGMLEMIDLKMDAGVKPHSHPPRVETEESLKEEVVIEESGVANEWVVVGGGESLRSVPQIGIAESVLHDVADGTATGGVDIDLADLECGAALDEDAPVLSQETDVVPESAASSLGDKLPALSVTAPASALVSENDICQCAVCGCYGINQEFLDGDGVFFCSQYCKDKRDASSSSSKKSFPRPDKVGTEIYQCQECGCYGLHQEFLISEGLFFCSTNCKDKNESLHVPAKKARTDKESSPLPPKLCSDSPLLPPKLVASASPTPSLVSNDSNNEAATASSSSSASSLSTGSKNALGQSSFAWTQYVEAEGGSLAPIKLFKNHFDEEAFPTVKNGFRVGMRLEAIDPKHQSMLCLVSVAEVRACRLRLHFDGYPDNHDVWVNFDSPNIFPLGWCDRNNKLLHPPKEFANADLSSGKTFSWQNYIKDLRATAAPRSLFPHLREKGEKALTPIGFRVGMKLEALDVLSPDRDVCVASVADILAHDNRFLIHLDGKDARHDYWAEATSSNLHPVDWCKTNGQKLVKPLDFQGEFDWTTYLTRTASLPVPARAFKIRPISGFRVGAKLEAVDPLNPILIRVATVVDIWTSKLKLHFDGWSEEYDFWVEESSPEIHPPGWCAKTCHPLQFPVNMSKSPDDYPAPPGVPGAEYCPTPGCQGLGHLNNWHDRHYNILNCPYFKLRQDKTLEEDRVTNEPIPPTPQFQVKGRGKLENRWVKPSRSGDAASAGSSSLETPKLEIVNGGGDEAAMNGVVEVNGRRGSVTMPALVNQRHGPPTPPPESEHPFAHGVQLHRPPSVVAASVHHSVFSPPFLPPPPPDVPLCWQHQSNLLPGVSTISKAGHEAITKWSPEDVSAFVANIPGCESFGQLFEEQAIDGEALLLLNQEDMVNIMGIKLGPAVKIYNAIVILKNKGEIPPPPLPCIYRLKCP